MAKYLLVYHGGGAMPGDEAAIQAEMAGWMTWFGSLGDKVVDGGNPVSIVKTIAADGSVSDGAVSPATGYSILEASSIDDAVKMANGCPILRNGGSIQVCETFNVG